MAARCEIVCASDKGMVRSGNEDAVHIDAASGFAVLADGMGGYAAGEVASRLAVDEIRAELETALPHLDMGAAASAAALAEDMRFAAQRANASILNAARRVAEHEGMGATLVFAVMAAGRIFVGHLGDSRAYRLRGGRLEPLTRDHCWLDEQISQGALQIDALLDGRLRNIVTRALGIDEDIELEVHDHDVLPGDVYLLCSDGLSDMLDDAQIEALLNEPGELADKPGALVAQANRNGGKDNVSVILMRLPAPDRRGWTSRLVRRIQGVGGSGSDGVFP